MNVAILGGTGNEGQGLALRWATAGVQVLLGSRSPEKAQKIAQKLNGEIGSFLVVGLGNREAAAQADVVVSTLPHQGHRETLTDLQDVLRGKLLVVATAVWPPGALDRPSAAEQAREVLGEHAPVVAAFQTVSASALRAIDHPMEQDVLICGDDQEACRRAVDIVALAGMRALESGPLRNSRIVEAMTAVLLHLNHRYRSKSAGLRVTGLAEP